MVNEQVIVNEFDSLCVSRTSEIVTAGDKKITTLYFH